MIQGQLPPTESGPELGVSSIPDPTEVTPDLQQEGTPAHFFSELGKELELMEISGIDYTSGREDANSLTTLSSRLSTRLEEGEDELEAIVSAVDAQTAENSRGDGASPHGNSLRIQMLIGLEPMLRTDEERETRAEAQKRKLAPLAGLEHLKKGARVDPEPGQIIITPQGIVRGLIAQGGYGRPAEIQTGKGIVKATDARLGNS